MGVEFKFWEYGNFTVFLFYLIVFSQRSVIIIQIKKIFSKKVAYALIRKEHDLLSMEDNLKFPELKVFIFRETPALLRDLTEITKAK